MGEGQSVEAGGLPLAGQRLLITAGGTREALDPVRFLGNRSSGKQGIALATAATELGAQVHLIAAHVEVEIPGNFHRVTRVSSALQLREAVFEHLAATDVLIMSAAVADFRPAEYADAKIKKTDDPGQDPVIRLVRNPDVLKEAVLYREENPQRAPHTIVGFAAETGDATTSTLDYGRAKLARKGCDYLAVNTVSETQGFGADSNTITLLSGQNDREVTLQGSKLDVSRAILRHIAQEFNNHSPSSPTGPREVQ